MKEMIKTAAAPAAIGPYSQGVAGTGRMLFVSGQLPVDPATGNFAGNGVQEQTEQSIKNLAAILKEAGGSLENVAKTTVFLADMEDFAAMNGVYQRYFSEPFPARSAVQVARLPKDARVEIEAIAIL